MRGMLSRRRTLLQLCAGAGMADALWLAWLARACPAAPDAAAGLVVRLGLGRETRFYAAPWQAAAHAALLVGFWAALIGLMLAWRRERKDGGSPDGGTECEP